MEGGLNHNRSEARIPTHTLAICLSGGCTCQVYHASMFTRTIEELLDASYLDGIPLLQYVDNTMFF